MTPKISKPQSTDVPRERSKKPKFIFQAPKGMHDLLPLDQPWWERIRRVLTDVAEFYNFTRIDTPILEDAALFERGVGAGTDIVEKEMYVLKTKGGDRLALRPEFTASIIRAYLEHGMSRLPQPTKLYYFGPVFRHENPQAGRYRQFYQAGFEIVGGESDPVYDAQVILTTCRFIEELKIKNLTVQVNTIGCKVCRQNYKRKLQLYYRSKISSSGKKGEGICKDCERRIETNPLRLLDCKTPSCQPIKEQAPSILDHLCTTCNNHFKQVLEFLDEIPLAYTLNPRLVRGLDYYNRTVFEVFAEGFDVALAGGGRYDYLGEMIGSRVIPAVGSSLGIERLIEVMKTVQIPLPRHKGKVFFVHIGELARKKSLPIIEEFRKAEIDIQEALGKDSLRAQLKVANDKHSPIALIFGQREAFEESIIVRDMRTGVQESVPIVKIVEEVKRRLSMKVDATPLKVAPKK